MRILRVSLALSLAFSGCARGLPHRVETAAAMQAAILQLVPIGTDIAEARRRVEEVGLKCEEPKLDRFAGQPDSLRFAYCDGSSSGDVFVSRRFQLALVDSTGQLSRVLATEHLVGP